MMTNAEALFADIQELYHNENVYKSIVVGDDIEQLDALYDLLHRHDYPVDAPSIHGAAPSALQRFLGHRTRMLLLSVDAYHAVQQDLPLEDCVVIRAPSSKL